MKQLNGETLTRITQRAYYNIGGYMSTVLDDYATLNDLMSHDSFEYTDIKLLDELEDNCRMVAETVKVLRESLSNIYDAGSVDESSLVAYLDSEEYKNADPYIEEAKVMQDTVKAAVGYSVKRLEDCPDTGALYDGDNLLMYAEIRSLDDYNDERVDNECFIKYEVFTTVKGNQFIYWGDLETGEDFLTPVVLKWNL